MSASVLRCCDLRSWCALLLALASIVFVGCGSEDELVTEYGWTEFPYGDSSVNGLGVFSEMFRSAGHDIATTSVLSPKAEQLADVIVWAPRDFAPPSQDAIDWLESWLVQKPGRTLIYVHRDFDAAPAYWREVGPTAPANLQGQVKAQATTAANDFVAARLSMPNASTDFGWFVSVGNNKPRTITTLQGDPNWTSAIDPTKLEIELIGDIQPTVAGSTVLASGAAEPLIIEEQRQQNSKILVLANGSFVLNYPLINHEHRKLAGRVIDEVGDDKYVVFLQAGSSPTILDEDPVNKIPGPFAFLDIAPINYVLLHLILFGLILCFARYPIFGIPRDDAPTNLSDFGEHIDALGALLARTGNTAYAVGRLQAFRKLVRGDHASTRNLAYAKTDELAERAASNAALAAEQGVSGPLSTSASAPGASSTAEPSAEKVSDVFGDEFDPETKSPERPTNGE